MTIFEEPTSAIVKKLKANTTLTALLPASHIHSSYPNASNATPSVYVFAVRLQRNSVVSSGNQPEQVYNGSSRFQLETYSTESQENAETLGRTACEAVGYCLVAAGLWNMSYEFRGGGWDDAVLAYRAYYFLNSSCSEWRSITV